MTREKFVTYKFKAYQLIDFKHRNLDKVVECMLVSVDFDTEIIMLRPFPNANLFKEDFPAHISSCELTRPKLKVSK